MPHFKTQSIITADIYQAFNLILDVENYHQFVPHCTKCKIISQTGTTISAEMSIRFGPIVANYNSSIFYHKPAPTSPSPLSLSKSPNEPIIAEVSITSYDPIFSHMESKWILEQVNLVTKIKFQIRVEFQNSIYNKLLGLFFERECRKITASFINRLNIACKIPQY